MQFQSSCGHSCELVYRCISILAASDVEYECAKARTLKCVSLNNQANIEGKYLQLTYLILHHKFIQRDMHGGLCYSYMIFDALVTVY
jgi:hypothetical protein